MEEQAIKVVKATKTRRKLIQKGYCDYSNTIIYGNVTVYNAPVIINARRTAFLRDIKEAMLAFAKAVLDYFELRKLLLRALMVVSLIIPSDLNVPQGTSTSLGKSDVPYAIMSGCRNEGSIKYEKIVKIESFEYVYSYRGKRYDRKQHIVKSNTLKGRKNPRERDK